MKLIGLLLVSFFMFSSFPQPFEGFIVYESVDNFNVRDTMIEYYSQNKLLTEYKGKNVISKHLVIVEDKERLINYIQNRSSNKWTRFILQTSAIDRPVFFNSNDSMIILDNVCRAIESKPHRTTNKSITDVKTIKSYLSDELFFFLTSDATDALNRIQLFREVKISSTNGAYDNITQRKAIKIVKGKIGDSLFMIPIIPEGNSLKK